MGKIWALIVIIVIAVGAGLGIYFLQRQGEHITEPIIQMSKNNPVITVVFDNNPYKEGLATGWGFSALIRGMEKTILFDTGADGEVLLNNMSVLGIDPREIDAVVLSHIHGDHTGGLFSFFEKNPNVSVYVPQSFTADFKKELEEYGAKVVDVKTPIKICEGVYSTGELGMLTKEQALILHTSQGSIVITGCAHPGVVNITKKAKDLYKDEVLFVMGGFHLGGESESSIQKIVSSFRELNVRYSGPCHCSGDLARQLFEEEYGENFIEVGVGKKITMDYLRED